MSFITQQDYHVASYLLQLLQKGIVNISNIYLNSETMNQMNKINLENLVLLSLPVSFYNFIPHHLSFISHSLIFYAFCVPKDSPLPVLKGVFQIRPHYCFKTSCNMDLRLLWVHLKLRIFKINTGNQQ